MARLIRNPTQVKAAGNKPKVIDEFIGRVNSGTMGVSIARMRSPAGWVEPSQTPEFTEYTVVLNGTLRVETDTESFDVAAGQAVVAPQGERICYSTPLEGGAEYIAVCIPAFAPEIVHRDD